LFCARKAVGVAALEAGGRVAAYVLDGRVGILVKHSSERLPPWQFTFTDGSVVDLQLLERQAASVWLVLVCGTDGLLALDRFELSTLTGDGALGTLYVRVDRDRRTLYRVSGNAGQLGSGRSRGVAALVAAIGDDAG
jgi:hypothetical protein